MLSCVLGKNFDEVGTTAGHDWAPCWLCLWAGRCEFLYGEVKELSGEVKELSATAELKRLSRLCLSKIPPGDEVARCETESVLELPSAEELQQLRDVYATLREENKW